MDISYNAAGNNANEIYAKAHFTILYIMNYKGCGKIGQGPIYSAVSATARTDCKTMQNICKSSWKPS
jgi:hypothetical protein